MKEGATLLEAIRKPISEANPCGVDVSWDENFRRVKAEIDRGSTVGGRIDHAKALEGETNSLAQTTGVDYAFIVKNSRALLGGTSKDLRVASYLVIGCYYTDGLRGLAEGLAALDLLVDTYWDAVYPAKMRARKGAFELMIARLTDELETYQPGLEDREPLEHGLALVEKLQAFLMQAMQEDAPVMSGLRERMSELVRRTPKPTPPPEPVAPEPVEESSVETDEAASPDETTEPTRAETPEATLRAKEVAAPTTPEAAETPGGAVQSAADALGVIGTGTAFLHTEDYTDAVPYRLSRVLHWETIRREPPHEDGTTALEPPEEGRRAYFNGLLEKARYAPLVEEAEHAFRETTFAYWLDLQRLLVVAMEALGTPFQAARTAVLFETAQLVRRLPGLPALAFSDGTPFADPQTQAWLQSLLPAAPGTTEPTVQDERAEEDRPAVARQYDEARKLLAQGDLAGALGAMQEGAGRDASPQERFRRRLAVASLCLAGNKPAVVRPLLERLAEEVEQHRLDVWDPALALETWTQLYTCYTALSETTETPEAMRERAGHAFEAICRLDTRYALSVHGKAVA